jgi:ribosomal protein L7/L12
MDTETEYRNRVRALELKVEFLLKELGLTEKANAYVPDISPVLAEIMPLIMQGNKIEAIKRYRELTGSDLRTAKEAVERML